MMIEVIKRVPRKDNPITDNFDDEGYTYWDIIGLERSI